MTSSNGSGTLASSSSASASSSEQPLACVILAAGKGTRMKSDLPKVLHPVLGRPLGHWPVLTALELQAEKTVVVVGHGAEDVEKSLKEAFGDDVKTALQAEQKGTGHAVMCALPALEDFEGSVLILYGDTPLLKAADLADLVCAQRESGAPLALLTAFVDDPTGYGRILRDYDENVCGIVEHKDANVDQLQIDEMNPGIYVVDASWMRANLDKLKADNSQGEYYLTDLVALAAQEGAPLESIEVYHEDILGVNDRAQLQEAAAILQERLVHGWMQVGVTLDKPDSVHIEATVHLDENVRLGPNVVLRGDTRIASGVHIDVGCVLDDTDVSPGAKLLPYTVCESAVIGENATVGPFARLRPETVLEKGSKVGNFVEMKKSTLGEGAKANHLAYIGDATVGKGANIGAGTITCNYDGHAKHQTILGDGAFIGSNSTLVAPVTIEDGAYVAAGSVVSKNVPENALAITRAKQENKEGSAERIRRRNAQKKKRQLEEQAKNS
ncbi:MAG: UDP-N-acetylglucosamine diphosphorylase/glucosamine-1-phosphate N-acetyltransferase [Deltaproteobacteria bacterium]|nr:UDP-N-acetylglucosamine diphosphorylase/glucosamine-1-phosphate N-acetyltransferase [Deltaproteobacteria bacterium]